jgi:molybdopterin-guanine dinucleotide biosynthesis protein
MIVNVLFRGREIELEVRKGINIFYGPNATGKSTLISAIVEKMKTVGKVKAIAHVRGDQVIVGNLRFDIHDDEAWNKLTAEPFLVYSIRDDMMSLLDVGYLHGGYALKMPRTPEEEFRWIPVVELSYGERKVIAILLVASMADVDVVVIEGFEGGLHFDLAVDLLGTLEDYEKYVLVETHMGILVTSGLKRGWNVYYVSRDGVTRLTKDNILETSLFKDETEALTRLAPSY